MSSSIAAAPRAVQIFRAIGPLLMDIFHLKMWGIQVSSANAVWVLI